MKQTKFSKLENTYYYGISRVFWHIIIGLASLAIIIGIGALIWSQIPPSEQSIEMDSKPIKQSYPDPIAVSLTELKNSLPKGEKLKEEKDNITKVDDSTIERGNIREDIPIRDTTGISNFKVQIGILKTLIPVIENNLIWNGSGRYVYRGGSRGEKMFKKTKNESLREWKSTSDGFVKLFTYKTDKQNLKSYTEKTRLLNSYNKLLKNIHKSNRSSIVKNHLINFYSNNTGLNKSIEIIESITRIIKNIDVKEQNDTFGVLRNFANNNPRDGIGLQNFQESIITKFEYSQRLNIIKTINKEYIYFYNNELAIIIENTNQFVPMVVNFKGDQQPVALKNFYSLYRNKNGNRNAQIQTIEANHKNQIREIENKYQQDLANAKAEYLSKQENKRGLKSLSLKSMGIGLGVVLLISLILLILSMIRNINKLAEAMLENNKNKTN